MAYPSIWNNVKAVISGYAPLTAEIGSGQATRLFLGQAQESTHLKWIEVEHQGEVPEYRSEDVYSTSTLAFHCLAKLSEDADALATMVLTLFLPDSEAAAFNLQAAGFCGIRWVGYMLGSVGRGPEGTLVNDGIMTFEFSMQRQHTG